jgi:hypothetical protein
MPNFHTSSGAPIAEPLELRLTRDLIAVSGSPAVCRRRQCRRTRLCGGLAHLAQRPIAPGEWLPPCIATADPALRREVLTLATELRHRVCLDTEPPRWPDDAGDATELRVRLAEVQRIHSRPGLHPDHEYAALAAWQALDPDPAMSAHVGRVVRHSKPAKRQPAMEGKPA